SCDETAVSIVEAKGGIKKPQFKIIADTVISQIELHKEYGGVFPSLAKREHTKNLLPVLITTLKKSGLLIPINKPKLTDNSLQQIERTKQINKILDREPELAKEIINFVSKNKKPKIDAVAVTYGPGLEPALWTGLNFAKALALLWNKPFVPVNHMEGHLGASLLEPKTKNIKFPALGLLLSGGHTELVLMKNWMKYKTIGQTRDDAVGEAYDKIARMLGFSYPGGPEVSKSSNECKTEYSKWNLPRPMIGTPDLDFSFSGLKTAVLYTLKKITKITPTIKKEIAREFEEAVNEVLLKKTKKALEKYKIQTLILGGGVVANQRIRKTFTDLGKKTEGLEVLIPNTKYTGDNATMIAVAGYFRYLDGKILDPQKTGRIKADGNLRL
ncbi:tRNA (adenosine(37)-N6)-threonylcarbamoyltransferase complex transferase subunit TsaD, partial [Patescibacteria group bacterium]|nr:tRNA (adenosine(37)-N6)-threonylcarbamoyltransferase complex transferase subunit TsaD [Patescibacteria group bacterium]